MSMLLTLALAASTVTVPSCSWDAPGHNPFMGDVVAAVDRYVDIPEATRSRLKQRMAARQYDEIATITRDSIAGKHRYTDLREMHFGQNQVCRTITRERWTAANQERGLVYCESGQCIIVPTVCRNVSRVNRVAETGAAAPARPGTAISSVVVDGPDTLSAGANNPPNTFQNASSPLPPPTEAPTLVAVLTPAPVVPDSGASVEDPPLLPGPPLDLPPAVPPPPAGVPPLVSTPVPEPSSWLMMAAGLLLLGVRRSRLNDRR
jgi:hypothetical protein